MLWVQVSCLLQTTMVVAMKAAMAGEAVAAGVGAAPKVGGTPTTTLLLVAKVDSPMMRDRDKLLRARV